MSGVAPPQRFHRDETRSHYDRYPYTFSERGILEEKMHKRVLGQALLELGRPDACVLDVGCGACRVASMARSAGLSRVIGFDISRETLRAAAAHNPDPLVNADNMQIPVKTGAADLVISNGVIMVTPDVRASFAELARIVKPGGTLVVSVYNKNCWYYPVYRYGGPVVRWLRSKIGDRGLRFTVFPIFHACLLVMMALMTKRPFWISFETAWSQFHDGFTIPHCTFHTFEEVSRWADEERLDCIEKRTEAANQLLTYRLKKPAAP